MQQLSSANSKVLMIFFLLKITTIRNIIYFFLETLCFFSKNQNLDRFPEAGIGSFPMFLVANPPRGIFGIIRLRGAGSNYWRVKNSPSLTEACCGIYLKHFFYVNGKRKYEKENILMWM